MTKLGYKVATGIATASLFAAAFVPAVFADTVVDVSGNGALSSNHVELNSSNSNLVTQSNTTTAVTAVNSSANTGGNNSSFNTGGNSSISTGAASNTTIVSVTGGSNTAVLPDCGCANGTTLVGVTGNGAFSYNKVKVNKSNLTVVSQTTNTSAVTSVTNKAKTGKNSSSFNTGGGSTIGTGSANNGTSVVVAGGSNHL